MQWSEGRSCDGGESNDQNLLMVLGRSPQPIQVQRDHGAGSSQLRTPSHYRSAGPRRLTSGQLSYDRSQRVGKGGADDDIGEADLLPSPLDFLGGGRPVIRKYGQRVRCAKRSRVGVGGRHERRACRR